MTMVMEGDGTTRGRHSGEEAEAGEVDGEDGKEEGEGQPTTTASRQTTKTSDTRMTGIRATDRMVSGRTGLQVVVVVVVGEEALTTTTKDLQTMETRTTAIRETRAGTTNVMFLTPTHLMILVK